MTDKKADGRTDTERCHVVSELSKIERVKCQLSVIDECCTVHYYLTGGVTVNHGRLAGASSERERMRWAYVYAVAAVTYSTIVAVPAVFGST